MPAYVYRVTKYDPADSDEHGHCTGAEDTRSDHGEVEASYLQAVAAFAAETGVDHLVIREPQVSSFVHFGLEPVVDGFGLKGLFPPARHGSSEPVVPPGFHDGAQVPLNTGLELVRAMLRDNGAWCRLEVEDVFTVHVGWDQYLYIGSSRNCEAALAQTSALGLFPERLASSPYDISWEVEGTDPPRAADDAFWDGLRRAVATGRIGVLEETHVEGAARWHRLTCDTIDTVRAGLAPRARLAAWPPLSSDIDSVLASFPTDGLVEGVWQDKDGRIRSVFCDETAFPELSSLISAASAASLKSGYAGEDLPLYTAVMPDSDGVVRARWQTDPTADDQDH
ncbi:RNA-binding protein [Streptomyces sp. AC555_RSS877]|uniref:RNA-binding protein n=1 Tax=Streptomyces sp. AC555_RSS877 TaxID=2823688 RepID=UPI001C25DA32|nr:RNA-binding protein [Streptomyces sp. AC555_RSS877]